MEVLYFQRVINYAETRSYEILQYIASQSQIQRPRTSIASLHAICLCYQSYFSKWRCDSCYIVNVYVFPQTQQSLLGFLELVLRCLFRTVTQTCIFFYNHSHISIITEAKRQVLQHDDQNCYVVFCRMLVYKKMSCYVFAEMRSYKKWPICDMLGVASIKKMSNAIERHVHQRYLEAPMCSGILRRDSSVKRVRKW